VRGKATLWALLFLAGCASGPPLRVGTSGDYAPFSKGGEGFDVEVAQRFAAELGRPVEWVPFRWPELGERAAHGDFDVAMSGVTWRADRDVHGWLSLAVGQGGPCWIGAAEPATLAVNRGGVLESFARSQFPKAKVRAVDDNESLPGLLAAKQVDAIVTDSFELAHFLRAGDPAQCEAKTQRKVYWVTPAHAVELGPALDAFLERREPELRQLRAKWFGAPQPRAAADDVIDLAARRLELMDFVGGWKRAHHLPVEDRAQETRVLDAVEAKARALGLEPAGVRRLFELQIALAKRIQTGTARSDSPLELEGELRPALARLSDRQLEALHRAAPISEAALGPEALAPLAAVLEPRELSELRAALLAIAPAR